MNTTQEQISKAIQLMKQTTSPKEQVDSMKNLTAYIQEVTKNVLEFGLYVQLLATANPYYLLGLGVQIGLSLAAVKTTEGILDGSFDDALQVVINEVTAGA